MRKDTSGRSYGRASRAESGRGFKPTNGSRGEPGGPGGRHDPIAQPLDTSNTSTVSWQSGSEEDISEGAEATIKEALGQYERSNTFPEQRLLLTDAWNVLKTTKANKWKARLALDIGRTFTQLGHFKKAGEFLNAAKTSLHQSGDSHGEGTASYRLGNLAMAMGDFATAATLHRTHDSLSRLANDFESVSIAMQHLGNVALLDGDLRGAMEIFQNQRLSCESIGNHHGVAIAMGSIGNLFMLQRRWADACTHHHVARRIFRAVHDAVGESASCNNLALCYIEGGQNLKACGALTRRVELCAALGDVLEEVRTLHTLAHVHFQLGNFNEATLVIRRAVANCKEKDKTKELLNGCVIDSGFISLLVGRVAEAKEDFSVGLQGATTVGNNEDRFKCFLGLALCSLFTRELGACVDVLRKVTNSVVYARTKAETDANLRAWTGSLLSPLVEVRLLGMSVNCLSLMESLLLELNQHADVLQISDFGRFRKAQDAFAFRFKGYNTQAEGHTQRITYPLAQSICSSAGLDCILHYTVVDTATLKQLENIASPLSPSAMDTMVHSTVICTVILPKSYKTIRLPPLSKCEKLTKLVPRATAAPLLQGLDSLLGFLFSAIRQQSPVLTQTLQGLYDWLIEPLAALLPAHTEPLKIGLCANGPLMAVPFACLHDGQRYLVQKADLSCFPSLAFLLSRYTAEKKLKIPRRVVCGVFDTTTTAESLGGLFDSVNFHHISRTPAENAAALGAGQASVLIVGHLIKWQESASSMSMSLPYCSVTKSDLHEVGSDLPLICIMTKMKLTPLPIVNMALDESYYDVEHTSDEGDALLRCEEIFSFANAFLAEGARAIFASYDSDSDSPITSETLGELARACRRRDTASPVLNLPHLLGLQQRKAIQSGAPVAAWFNMFLYGYHRIPLDFE